MALAEARLVCAILLAQANGDKIQADAEFIRAVGRHYGLCWEHANTLNVSAAIQNARRMHPDSKLQHQITVNELGVEITKLARMPQVNLSTA